MRPRSLLFRLSAAAAFLIALALTLAGFGLTSIFNRELERRAADELTSIVNILAGQVRLDAQGAPVLEAAPQDPRFDTPYGGLYWQVGTTDGRQTRSRSLWDFVLDAPTLDGGERRIADIEGPSGARLLAVARRLTIESGALETELVAIAALDRSELAIARRAFLGLLVPSLAALGIILAVAMSLFLRLAFAPFRVLGRGLRDIHAGTSRKLEGRFPDEVQPIVDDLNRLIAFQDAAVERARTQAGDLAHGLKTPLAVLDAIARQASDEGRKDIAQPVEEQVRSMQRQVDRSLARARAGHAAALGGKLTIVGPVADKLIRALRRLPDSRNLDWHSNIALDAVFAGEDGDLVEILGNLLDNARKWARSKVRLTVFSTASTLTITIEDDGPGLSEEQSAQIARGRRWDETQAGTGFGLAIARDLVEAYRGSLALDRSELGGLRITLTFPAPASRTVSGARMGRT